MLPFVTPLSMKSRSWVSPKAVRTELHFHLLPGIDDGPRDDREAIELARLAVADGTRRVVATPHVRLLDLDELPMRTAQLRARLRALLRG